MKKLYVVIVFVVVGLGFGWWWGRGGEVEAAPVAAGVYDALRLGGGEGTFWVYLEAQADLGGAAEIDNWERKGEWVYRALRGVAEEGQRPLLNSLNNLQAKAHVNSYQPYWIVNVIRVTGDETAVAQLASVAGVAEIRADLRLPELAPAWAGEMAKSVAVEWGIAQVGAPDVWSSYNITGTGVTIGIIDTGAEWDHPALINSYRGWDGNSVDHNYNWYNPEPTSTVCSDPLVPCDWHNHGTHVTGITVGDDGVGNQVGMAPGAKWIHALGCCPSGEALLAALQWMLAPTDLSGANPQPSLRPQVVNNSWGGWGGDEMFGQALAALRAAGVVPVVAAGNIGRSGCGTLNSPGDNWPSFSVGASTTLDTIWDFSSRGPSPLTGEIGPEIVAPGRPVRSSIRGGNYGGFGGTSQAAPHVAGGIALLLAAEPALWGEVDQIEALLRGTAVPIMVSQACGGVAGSEVPNNTAGWGRLAVATAVGQVVGSGKLVGTAVTANGSGLGAEIGVSSGSGVVRQVAGGDGGFDFVLGGGVYTVTAEAWGYWPTTTMVSVTVGMTTSVPLTLTAMVTGTLQGQVYDSGTGLPVPGVMVGSGTSPVTATSSVTGFYRLPLLPQESGVWHWSRAGYVPLTTTVGVTATSVVDVWLTPRFDYYLGEVGTACQPAYEWLVATGGDSYALADSGYVAVSLAEPFDYYENSYSQVYVNANGSISFGAGQVWMQYVVPFVGIPNNGIYGFMADLNPNNGSQGLVWVHTLADGRTVISYEGVEHWPSGWPETWQFVLDPATGRIQIQYQMVSAPEGITVGLEDMVGERGSAYTGVITDGLSLGWWPHEGAWPACMGQVIIEVTGDDLGLSWLDSETNCEYGVYRDDEAYFVPSVAVETISGVSYADVGILGSGAAWFYRVEADNCAGGGAWSQRVGGFRYGMVIGE
ncbi:MAG TPA: S8 family serine peptidase [Anaerolineae bacterium]|nr:S8 family serine peptidase [Anaerolineae bacterium]